MDKISKKRKLDGVVVSDKMQKTIVVAVVRLKKHPLLGKYFKVTTRYKAHDEKKEYKTGDKVTIQEIRPLSKDKRWEAVSKV